MFWLSRPSEAVTLRFIDKQRSLEFTYAGVGDTAGMPPAGYVVDRVRVKLGEGEEAFAAGPAALGRWEQFRLGWVEPLAPTPGVQVGEAVAIGVRVPGVWWLNASRIVYVIDDMNIGSGERTGSPIPPQAPPFEGGGSGARFGFAYGTLPGHAESREERFLIEWDRSTNEVWYSILAFSQPRHWLARLGRPLVRRMQRRFGRESAAAMVRAVERDLSQRR
jgi:uncharacterized protein (UPF0548 family)